MTQRRAFTSSVFLLHSDGSSRSWPTREVLLVHHKRFDLWLPVGGELELNETPLEAAIREVREETGFELKETNFPPSDVPYMPRGFFCYEEHDGKGKGWHMNFCFHAFVTSKDVKLCDEHSQLRWVDLDNISEIGSTTTANVLWCLNELRRRYP